MTYNWRIGQVRGANVVNANPQRLESDDRRRYALGRNVKGGSKRGPGYYEIVEVWTLKEHIGGSPNRSGGWPSIVVGTLCDRGQAEAWVNKGVKP